MSAGTLTLTNNSDAVTGSGTAFTTELAAGDFIVVKVGGVPYTLPIKAVNSNTSLTLVSNYTGPTQSGAAWSAVPRVALNMVTASLVAQSVEALRGLNYDKQNWQAVFSASGMITVFLPDGSSFSGPSWKSIADTLDSLESGFLKKANNLSDLENRNQAWKNILPAGATITNYADGASNVWPVFINDATAQETGVVSTGGRLISSYRIAGTEVARATFSVSHSLFSSGYRDVTAVIEAWSTDTSNTWSFNHGGDIIPSIGALKTRAPGTLTGGISAFGGEFIGLILKDDTGPDADVVGKWWSWSLNGQAGSQFIARNRAASSTGQIVINMPASSGTLALQGTSGINYKHDIVDASLDEAVNRIDALRMVNFVYNDDEQERLRLGIIAEEAEKVAPQYIKHNSEEIADIMDDDGNKIGAETRDRPSVDNNPIVMDLLGYVKHLRAEIEMLKTALKG